MKIVMKKNPYWYLFLHLWKYAPSKKLVTWMLVFSFVSKILWLLSPWIIGNIINLLQLYGYAARDSIVLRLVAYAVIAVGGRVFHGFSRVREQKNQFDVAQAYMMEMFRKVASLPMQRQLDNHSGVTIDKIQK
ncbi:MAG: ABC transporter ATP-binding protein [Candidatus Peribacteria bacterium]|nr:MAG: ABC transporter ATP-binding protein [Candidatus Peribacteria bacterium]